ncbi:MAG: hypothetical protein LBR12_03925 [Opitutaceae bacterium]|jgi:hypothetical protein|nr:hypothetical protein [Opitutaceae bacterium]
MKSKKALFRALCVITALAPAAPAALLTDSFESPGPGNLPAGWRAGFHGNVSASVVRDASVARSGNASVCFANRSPLAANVWVSLTRETPVPVAGLDALTLSLHARGVAAGRAFVSVVFQPSGGETRLYLPEGDFPWRRVAQDIPVPDGAASVILRIGSEAPSTALHLDDLSLEPCPRKLSGLPALFLPRQPAADGSVRLFPSAPPPDPDLTVLDIARLDQDEQLLATTLQGLVNTTRPRLYLVHNPNDRFWLARLLGQKHIRSASELPSLAAAVEKFRGEIAGVTVPDPAVPATRHTAMLLGALDATVATSRQAAARYNLPVKTDLAGRFSKNVQAYRHLWENHRGRLASHVLAVHHPAMTHNGPRDYLAQQRVFTFWISSYADPHPAADPAAEMEFAAEVLAATPPNIPVMGWFSFGDTQGLPEYDAVRLVSGYAKFLAGSEFNTNLSLLSGIRVPAKTFRQRRQPAPPAPDTPAVLLSFSVMDSGDSLWYWQHYQHKHWLDPERGSVPVNWSMNPTRPPHLPTRAPRVF